MKIRNTITKVIAITLVVAAMVVTGSSWAAGRAGAAGLSDPDIYIKLGSRPVGIIPEQKLRISVGSAANSSTRGWFRYQTTSPSGVPLYESEWIQVLPGEFRFSDVSRRDLNTEGEPETGRAQVMVTVTIQAPSGSKPEDFSTSLEVINVATGATSGISLGNILIHEVGHTLGFIPGQRVSYSFFNPNEEGGEPVRVQAYIYDSSGNLLRQSDPVEVPAGQFRSFDFNRDDLPLAGEPSTGRLQVRGSIQVLLGDGSARSVSQGVSISVEVIENSTGKTTVRWYIGYVKVSPTG